MQTVKHEVCCRLCIHWTTKYGADTEIVSPVKQEVWCRPSLFSLWNRKSDTDLVCSASKTERLGDSDYLASETGRLGDSDYLACETGSLGDSQWNMKYDSGGLKPAKHELRCSESVANPK